MTETNGRILVVTTDKTLVDDMTPSAAGRGLELVYVQSLGDAATKLGTEEFTATVVDFGRIPPDEREQFLALHKHKPKVHFFMLETIASIAPDAPAPLRRLGWPLPSGFTDQVRATDRPVVILADQTLFTTAAVQMAFQQADDMFYWCGIEFTPNFGIEKIPFRIIGECGIQQWIVEGF